MFEQAMKDTATYTKFTGNDDYGVASYATPVVVKCHKETTVKIDRTTGAESVNKVNLYLLPKTLKDISYNDLLDGVPIYSIYVVKAFGFITHVEVTTT